MSLHFEGKTAVQMSTEGAIEYRLGLFLAHLSVLCRPGCALVW